MTAVEALRRARATMECWDSMDLTSCEANEWPYPEPYTPGVQHKSMASALLDGFSVEEVTAAEHTTDQPHE